MQAFGRNNVPDKDLYRIGRLRVQGESDIKLIEKLADAGFDPGGPNTDLAKEMRDLMGRYNIPTIAQWEVIVAAFLDDHEWTKEHSDDLMAVWPPPRKQARFDITHVKKETARIMMEKDLHMPIELAHAAMIARAFLIVKKSFWHRAGCCKAAYVHVGQKFYTKTNTRVV